MKAKEAREKRKAKVIADIESIMKELQTPPEKENMLARKPAKERTTVALDNLLAELQVWTKRKRMQCELEKKAHVNEMIDRLKAHIRVVLGEMKIIMKQENDDLDAIVSKRDQICSLGEKLGKRLKAEMVQHYADQFEETKRLISCLASEAFSSNQYMFYYNLIDEDSSKGKVPPESQPSSSSSAMGCYSVFQREAVRPHHGDSRRKFEGQSSSGIATIIFIFGNASDRFNSYTLNLKFQPYEVNRRRRLPVNLGEKMDFDRDNVRLAVDDDRLSSLPEELILRILDCNDTKYAVETSLLSPRWRFLWKSVSRLNFSSRQFDSLPKFSKFVKKILLHRILQNVEVSSVNLNFHGAASQIFVENIAQYAYSHNVQELTIVSDAKKHHEFPSCLFSSPTLKHFTLKNNFLSTCITPTTPWDFPALTTLYLGEITLCDDNRGSVDLFSKCVNLQTLTLVKFIVKNVEAFEIIAPRLSNLVLKDGKYLNVVNVVAPNLENLTIDWCLIKSLNAPHGITCLCYTGYDPPQWFKDGFHSLKTVTLTVYFHCSMGRPYIEEDARRTINMLQAFHSTKFLTLNTDILEGLFGELENFQDVIKRFLRHHDCVFNGFMGTMVIPNDLPSDDYQGNIRRLRLARARGIYPETLPLDRVEVLDPVMQGTTLPATQASLKRSLFHFSQRSIPFYRLSHYEIVEIEKVAVRSSLQSPNNKSALIESRANEINQKSH
nr:hypothetical protein [Tanacetum cinerariifolium]